MPMYGALFPASHEIPQAMSRGAFLSLAWARGVDSAVDVAETAWALAHFLKCRDSDLYGNIYIYTHKVSYSYLYVYIYIEE